MRRKIYLQLGRVSNLPTVWTNVLAGVVLAGGNPRPLTLLGPLLSGSLFYVGGMFLNDAFDREIDARERPERPIPSGQITAGEVFAVGFGMLFAGWLILLVQRAAFGSGSGWTLLAGAALGGAIVLYNIWHKGNRWSPVLMGLCRALLYLTAGLAAVTRPSAALVVGALILLAYLIGLTYVAKQETLTHLPNLWPLAFLAAPFVYAAAGAFRTATGAVVFVGFLLWVINALRILVRRAGIGRAVVSLIAGISLLDALLIARAGEAGLAWAAVGGFVATLFLQRYVKGT